MARRSIKNELKDFAFGAMYASISLETINIMADWYTDASPDHAWPFVIGTGLVAFGRYCNYHLQKTPTISFGQTESRRRVLISGKPAFLSAVPLIGRLQSTPRETQVIKYRPLAKIERFWDVTLTNREAVIRVYEPRLLNLCETAYRRERSGIASNERYPFSRNYFTKQHRPRFPLPLYAACLTILNVCDLLDGRSRGASGRLRYRPVPTVELVKDRFGAEPDWVG
jgi:hypothetical protein